MKNYNHQPERPALRGVAHLEPEQKEMHQFEIFKDNFYALSFFALHRHVCTIFCGACVVHLVPCLTFKHASVLNFQINLINFQVSFCQCFVSDFALKIYPLADPPIHLVEAPQDPPGAYPARP